MPFSLYVIDRWHYRLFRVLRVDYGDFSISADDALPARHGQLCVTYMAQLHSLVRAPHFHI